MKSTFPVYAWGVTYHRKHNITCTSYFTLVVYVNVCTCTYHNCAGTFPEIHVHLCHVSATKYKMSSNNVSLYLIIHFLLCYNNNSVLLYTRKVYTYAPPVWWRTILKKKEVELLTLLTRKKTVICNIVLLAYE